MDHLERYRKIIPEFERFLAVQSLPLPISARINTLKADRDSLLQRLEKQNIKYESFDWYPLGIRLDLEKPGKLLEYLLGYIHIQEEVSMVPPLVLDPQPGEFVLDMCAAPGSKTTQISQAMKNQGVVFANEPSLARIAPLRSNCERLGAVNVAITRYDGRRFPDTLDPLFHRVLVDAPCSSEGRARRDPDLLSRCSSKRSLDIQVLQTGLLRRAIKITRPGGVIVYSTCTYAPEENELVVQKVLDEVRLEQFSLPGLRKSPGITEWEGEELDEDLKRSARYYPHQNDTGGFFVAKLIKR
jgi:NOL1/NOP2/sun family putative RNA methylase